MITDIECTKQFLSYLWLFRSLAPACGRANSMDYTHILFQLTSLTPIMLIEAWKHRELRYYNACLLS